MKLKYFCYLYYFYVLFSIVFNIFNFKNNIGISIVSSYIILLSAFFFRKIYRDSFEKESNIKKFETVLIALNICLFLSLIVSIDNYKNFIPPIVILSTPSIFFILLTKKVFLVRKEPKNENF